jgi:mannose-6-phosphate isomerase-like protein (cupin superfamily)
VNGAHALAEGLSVAVLLGPADGSVHMELAISELRPGGRIRAHIRPFEESFFLLSGSAVLTLGGQTSGVRQNDFGFAPIGIAHGWHNAGTEAARWFRVRAPQPRPIGEAAGTYPAPRALGADSTTNLEARARTVDELDPFVRFLGHFSEEDMPAPGPLSMPGYHGQNVRGVSIRMMVDEVLGAHHHTLFMVEFTPSTAKMPGAKEHFHPFKEAFFFVSGSARASLAGEEQDVRAGDVLFLGVNASHGIRNTGSDPVRWIEVQAPKPPPSDGYFFEDEWRIADAERRRACGERCHEGRRTVAADRREEN